ncbi:MAG: metal ABC transporter solute-binding protein, Zn/Mn family, partial [Gammaproteobacteria bacterium]
MRLDPHTNPRPWFPTILAGVGMTLLLLTATASRAADNAAPRAVATILPLHSLLTVVMDGVSTPELLIPPAQSPHAVRLRPSQATSLDRADLIVWVGPNLESGLSKSIRVHGADTRVLTLVSEPSLRPLAARTGGAWEGHHDHHGEHEGGHEGEHEHEHEHGTGHDSDEGKEHAHEGDHHDDHADQERGDGDHHHAEGAQDEAVSGEQIDPHPWLSPDRSAAIARAMASALSEIDPAHAPRYRSNTDALLAR